MIAAMTRATAELFGLDVGRLEPGAPADLLVVDPSRLEDGPDLGGWKPDAVRWSLIAGQLVVADGTWLGRTLPSMALRRDEAGR
jgi:N-acyl-D-amino-acid deacylase